MVEMPAASAEDISAAVLTATQPGERGGIGGNLGDGGFSGGSGGAGGRSVGGSGEKLANMLLGDAVMAGGDAAS